MPKSHETRVDALERAGLDVPCWDSFIDELRRARLRALAGETIPETPITPESMDDPVYGEFYRQLFEARKSAQTLA